MRCQGRCLRGKLALGRSHWGLGSPRAVVVAAIRNVCGFSCPITQLGVPRAPSSAVVLSSRAVTSLRRSRIAWLAVCKHIKSEVAAATSRLAWYCCSLPWCCWWSLLPPTPSLLLCHWFAPKSTVHEPVLICLRTKKAQLRRIETGRHRSKLKAVPR